MSSTNSSALGAGAGASTIKDSSIQHEDLSTLYEKYGPICNSEGFYQHSGECWSDALQMMMLYTDGLKEVTQSTFLLQTIDYDSFKEKCEEYVTHRLEKYAIYDSAILEQNLKSLFHYFQIVQKRFQRHYLAEVKRFEKFGPIESYSKHTFENKCLDDLQRISAESRSETTGKPTNKPGVRAAILSKMTKDFLVKNREEIIKEIETTPTLKNTNYNTSGQVETDIINLVHLYSRYFNLDITYKISTIKDFKYQPDVLTMYLHITDWENTKGHAITFLTCGGNDYYYDNNRGILLFPWRKLLQRYTEESAKQKTKLFLGGEAQVLKLKEKNKKGEQDIDTILFKSTMWPFLEYTKGGAHYFVTYVAEQEEPVEYNISKFYSSRRKSGMLMTTVKNILYIFDIRKTESDYSIYKIVEIFKETNEYTSTQYNRGTGKFLQARLRPEYGLIETKKETIVSSATSGGNRRKKSLRKRKLYKSVTRKLK